MNEFSDDGVVDARIDGLWAVLAPDPPAPSPGTRAAVHAAARRRALRRPGEARGRWLLGLGLLATVAFAGAVAYRALQGAGSSPVAGRPPFVAAPVITGPATAMDAAPLRVSHGPTSRAAQSRRPLAAAGDAGGLRLPPPAETPFPQEMGELAQKEFAAFIASDHPGTYVVGLLLDEHQQLLRTAGPVALPDPPPGATRPDSPLSDQAGAARQLFGLDARDVTRFTGTSLPQLSPPSGPQLMVWSFVLRTRADIAAEASVRTATSAFFHGQLPRHDAATAVPLLTAVMGADGSFARTSLDFRPVPEGGSLAADSFVADRSSRFAELGLSASDVGREGAMLVASEDLPGDAAGGLVLVEYAWPRDVQAAVTEPNPNEDVGVDPARALKVLKALFTQDQLGDSRDGGTPWALMDHEGRVLLHGRTSGSDPSRPLQLELVEQYRAIRIDASAWTSVPDPAVPGRSYGAAFFWLAADSPLPR